MKLNNDGVCITREIPSRAIYFSWLCGSHFLCVCARVICVSRMFSSRFYCDCLDWSPHNAIYRNEALAENQIDIFFLFFSLLSAVPSSCICTFVRLVAVVVTVGYLDYPDVSRVCLSATRNGALLSVFCLVTLDINTGRQYEQVTSRPPHDKEPQNETERKSERKKTAATTFDCLTFDAHHSRPLEKSCPREARLHLFIIVNFNIWRNKIRNTHTHTHIKRKKICKF